MKIFMTLVFATFSVISFFALVGYWTNRQLETEDLSLTSETTKKLTQPLKILHVSDIHAVHLRVSEKKLFTASLKANPDLILITGDTIDRTEALSQSRIAAIIEQFTEIAPTYVVEGNHERTNPNYEDWRQLIKDSAATLLEDEVLPIVINDLALNLIGLTNGMTRLPESEAAKLAGTPHKLNLLLAHHPELFDDYLANFKATPLTAIFSGHAHGGQIRLAGNEGLLAPNQGFSPTFTNGAYRSNTRPTTTLYVSRGLSNSVFPFRINNKPHLISLTLN